MSEYIAEDLYDPCGSLIGVISHGELIRCKDCKHWRYNACFVDSKTSEDAESIILDRFADDYCSKAERKEENGK